MVFAVIDSLIAPFESSRISIHGLCCEWFPDCYPRTKQGFHNRYLLWISRFATLESNLVRFPHLVFAVDDSLIATLEYSKISTPGLCLNVSLTATLESSKISTTGLWIESSQISTSGLCCEWFPDCCPRIKQDFNTWSFPWMISWLLLSNRDSTSGFFCKWFSGC